MSPTAKHPIVAPFYAAAVTWLLYALLLPLYRPLHFVCAITAAAMVFLISYFICRSGAKKADANEAKAQSAEQKAAAQAGTPSGNPALDKVMKDYLEDSVDEKYYINSDKSQALIDKLLADAQFRERER